MRPRVIVNCAASIDGKIALASRKQTRLSSEEDVARVRALRAEVDAIMVGVGTVLADDPGLLAPASSPKKPLRVVVDSRGRTPRGAKVLDGSAPTLIAMAGGGRSTFPNAETAHFGTGRVDLAKLLEHLHGRGVGSVLVEGGGTLIFSLLEAKLADELIVFVSDVLLGGRDAPTVADGPGFLRLEDAPRPSFVEAKRLGAGTLLHYRFGAAP